MLVRLLLSPPNTIADRILIDGLASSPSADRLNIFEFGFISCKNIYDLLMMVVGFPSVLSKVIICWEELIQAVASTKLPIDTITPKQHYSSNVGC